MVGISPLVLPKAGPQLNPGRQLVPGDDINSLSGAIFSAQSGLTALSGGGRTGAVVLAYANNQFATVAADNDSCVLPPSYAGLEVFVENDGAHSLQVFGNGTDTINGTAGATGVALTSGSTAMYRCIVAGKWLRFVSS